LIDPCCHPRRRGGALLLEPPGTLKYSSARYFFICRSGAILLVLYENLLYYTAQHQATNETAQGLAGQSHATCLPSMRTTPEVQACFGMTFPISAISFVQKRILISIILLTLLGFKRSSRLLARHSILLCVLSLHLLLHLSLVVGVGFRNQPGPESSRSNH